MKYFITGGAGFLGASLVKKLVSEKRNVTVFDNCSRGNLKRLEDIQHKIKFIDGDIRSEEKVIQASAGHNVFIHLAAINGTELFYKKPQEVLDVSVRGILNSIEASKKNNIKFFILASSSEVYQTPKTIPTREDVELIIPDIFNPRYSYGGGKIISELICLNYYKDFFEKMIIFRPHNVYGPDMGWEHVIPQIINNIKESKKSNKGYFRIKGNGKQKRAFIFIDDFTEALTTLMFKGMHRNIYHIGNSEEITIIELVKEILKIMQLDLKIQTMENPKGETTRRCPETSKITELGYKKRTELKDGLIKVVNWYLKNEK
mgnify:CR=1 FL=1|tara:strand:+ start:1809 stop:2759 length:951 start_codon:yes stop_codon:yes gene_type:complete